MVINMNNIKNGFEPVYDSNSKILILGSFPSVISFKEGFYYGNHRNRFWSLMNEFFGGKVDTIADKKELLLANNIAIWDIVLTGENTNNGKESSADSNLKCEIVADIPMILEGSKVSKIICNGKKAYELFCKHYPNLIYMSVCLPSTSPANVRFDKTLWQKELGIME